MRNDFIHMLRGVAALTVVLFHAFKHTADAPALSAIRHMTDYGYLGVSVFFVISGFVIANSLRSAWVSPRFAGRYILRRMLRLDPPYWLTIIAAVLLAGAVAKLVGESPEWPSWQNLLAHVFYLQGVFGWYSLSVGLWTLCLEVQFYLSMLVLVAASQRTRVPLGWIVALLAAGSLLLSTDISESSVPPWRMAYISLLPNFSIFALGILGWLVVTQKIDWRWWLPVNAICVARLVWWPEPELAAGLAVANLIVLNGLSRLPVPKLSAMMFLGTISYSLYLSHPLTLRVCQLGFRRLLGIDSESSLLASLVAVALSIPVAYVMFWLVERPSMAWSESLKEKREEPISSGHAAKEELPEPESIEA